MSNFIQLHLLTAYPPSNLNRDDLGRPKTAIMGGATRLRVSSQSLKRAWRTSEVFFNHCGGNIGTRTRKLGTIIMEKLRAAGFEEKLSMECASDILNAIRKGVDEKSKSAKKTKKEKANTESDSGSSEKQELIHFSQYEFSAVDSLITLLASEKRKPTPAELKILSKTDTSIDIAMFGRMLASNPSFNCEAAVQVAHAITVHEVAVEDDFFTAVDDLNLGEEDLGAGHMGEVEFGSGLFYLYLCINRDLLLENLDGDTQLAAAGMRGLVEAATRVAPTGKQNSFASRAYASYLLAEKGTQQPRSLAAAFLEPVRGKSVLGSAITSLEDFSTNMDAVYGSCADARARFNVLTGEGSLDVILHFITE